MKISGILQSAILLTGFLVISAEVQQSATECRVPYYLPPNCINTPDLYICQCTPGFMWNGHHCMANSVNSKLVFPAGTKSENYVQLVDKTFPDIRRFTVALWVNFSSEMVNRTATLVSYTKGKKKVQIRLTGGSSFRFTVASSEVDLPSVSVVPKRWTHLAITWAQNGSWASYVNGERRDSGVGLSVGGNISTGGVLAIGSTVRRGNRSVHVNYIGDMGQVHVWDRPFNDEEVVGLYNDCTFSYCGNIVSWTDFRDGTRGAVKLLWHANIFQYCGIDREIFCDNYCSKTLGPKCEKDYEDNLKWPRTDVGTTAEQSCPSLKGGARASRPCLQSDSELVGAWGPTNMSACISRHLKDLNDDIQLVIALDGIEPSDIRYLVGNVTETVNDMSKVTNPSDLAACIEIIDLLVQIQSMAVSSNEWTENEDGDVSYPSISDTHQFVQDVGRLVDSLLDGPFDIAWNATRPRGYEAIQLLEVLDRFVVLIVRSLSGHRIRRETDLSTALVAFDFTTIALFVRLSERSEIANITLPDKLIDHNTVVINERNGALGKGGGTMTVPDYHQSGKHDIIGYSYVKLTSFYRLLPNHPEPVVVQFYRHRHLAFAHLENNVNTALLTFSVYKTTGEKEMVPLSAAEPLKYQVEFADTFNISNPTCVYLNKTNGPEDWSWSSEGCQMLPDSYDGERVTCLCRQVGTVAVTTHMYDDNWDPGEPPRFFPKFPMYIGAVVSIFFFSLALVGFFYFRCVSDTVAVHRNLAAAEILSLLLFLIGTPRIQNEWACRIIAMLIHFLFISGFGWICNEAFNLYVEVANSIHSEHQQQRPMLRYYVIGWFAPAILVAVLAATNWQEYFASNVCFMDLRFVWFMIGPAAGLWGITMFVLIYTAKDVSESSYFKDEKTNKVITHHCKGCWIQIVLVVITWSFALLSVDMLSIIPQILFAMFAILQGAFFFTFFCCLNGEVTEAINDYRMGMKQTSSLQRNTRYSIYRRYVPRPTTRRTLSNQSMGSSSASASQTPRRNSLISEATDEEDHEVDLQMGGAGRTNPSLREQVLRSSVDKMKLMKRGGSARGAESSIDDPPSTPEPENKYRSFKEEVMYSDPSSDLAVTSV